MEKEKKRRHHYVWQFYLDAWTVEGQIHCRRGSSFFSTNTINVAQKRDFYRVPLLNRDELRFLDLYGKALNNSEAVQRAYYFYLNIYQDPVRKREQLRRMMQLIRDNNGGNIPDNIQKDFDVLDKQLDVCANNMIEDYYSSLESEAIPWIESLRNHSMDFYFPAIDRTSDVAFDDQMYRFLHFVSVQYFRTKAIKCRLTKSLDAVFDHPDAQKYSICRDSVNLENLAHLLIYHQQEAVAFYMRKIEAPLTLLVNQSTIPFITSDQPVINLRADYQNPKEITSGMVLYYPISPSTAILINGNHPENKLTVSETEVENYNKKIASSSYELLFANSESILKRYS